MAKTTGTEDQFLFLINCIKYSSNGKIDFDKVAQDCKIVSKGAAAKRYERLMKSYGIHQSQGPTGRDTGVQPLRSKANGDDDEEDAPSPKKRKRAAPKAASKSASPTKAGAASAKSADKRKVSMTETEEDEEDIKSWEQEVKKEENDEDEVIKDESVKAESDDDTLTDLKLDYTGETTKEYTLNHYDLMGPPPDHPDNV